MKKMQFIDYVIYFLLCVVMLTTLYPFLNVLATSLSSFDQVVLHPTMIFPRNINFQAYKIVLRNQLLLSSYLNTVLVAVFSTLLGISLTVLTAYPLSESRLKGRKLFMRFLLITMLFGGGLIPNFILIRELGLYNSLLALIIPGSLGAYNIFLMVSFLQSIPPALKESAKIDGANEIRILVQIIIPVSIPAIAAISLFYAVGNWNQFFNALIYIRDREKWTLQLLLREIVIAGNANFNMTQDIAEMDSYLGYFNLKTANIIVTTLPIICLYPFLQKYFIKGIMLGAIKG